MLIGVPREVKTDEYRVAMLPVGAEELTRAGHQVLIESGAGLGSGISDDMYAANGATHPDLLARLGELYARRISPLGPRVMVQGNPVYLAQPGVVGEVRATLLAGLRSAVLWRQLGGSWWDLVLSRRRLVEEARALLETR